MILYKKIFNENPALLTNIIFSFFPISFILGSLIVNLNTLAFCCLGIFHLKSKILKIKYDFSIKVIFLFFCIILLSTSISFVEALYLEKDLYNNLENLIKSLAFFRFFLMLIIICRLSELKILEFKYFFVSASICALFLSLDVIFQYSFGFDIIGLKGNMYHNSGFFGEELVAGGFIRNFSFFSIFFIYFFQEKKNKFPFVLTVITICILGTGIMLSGNRMQLPLFLLGLLVVFLLSNKFKKIIFISTLSLLLIFQLITSNDKVIKVYFETYIGNAQNIVIGMFRFAQNNNEEKNKKDTGSNFSVNGEETTNPKLLKLKEDFGECKITTQNFIKELQKLGIVSQEKIDHHLRRSGEKKTDSIWTSHDTKSGYIKLFYTALDTWKKNKIFGNGIKSFRVDCLEFSFCEIKAQKENRACSNHPHNYYLEILTETGILGILITLVIATLFLIFIFKNLKLFRKNNLENLILLAATTSLILETFPIKSTGSIFTTNSATYLILICAIVLSYKKIFSLKS